MAALPGPVSVKVEALMVCGDIASLKVAWMAAVPPTPVAAGSGSVDATVGAVVSAVAPVVKVHAWPAASALPARSLAPVVMVAVNSGPAASAAVGRKVA